MDDPLAPLRQTLNAEDQGRLDDLYSALRDEEHTFVGYPCTTGFDYSPLFRFLGFPLNNVGDPFAPSTFRISTRAFEVEVLRWFARRLNVPTDGFWGYVNNGGTEGNMYGLYLARELHPQGMVYYSQDVHYSVSKIMRVLNMRHIMIRSQPNGEMDYDDLRETIRIHRDVPPILFLNVGSTMKEAVDDVSKVRAILKELAVPEAYLHADAALAGMTLPFCADAPVWDFRAGIDSMAISGHKFIGSPIPCGVVLARKKNVDLIARNVEYVGALDTTLTGSRNAFSPLILWYAIQSRGIEGFRQLVSHCRQTAATAVERFNAAGLPAWKNPLAITVIIPRPSPAVLDKWQIAVQDDFAHIICMPRIGLDVIDELIADMQAHPAEVSPATATASSPA